MAGRKLLTTKVHRNRAANPGRLFVAWTIILQVFNWCISYVIEQADVLGHQGGQTRSGNSYVACRFECIEDMNATYAKKIQDEENNDI